MTLPSGSRLGPYEILAPLGRGGMGEVYRARDTRLGREVAIKTLPKDFAEEPERLRRFEREARSASALTDPHIVTLYDVGEANGIRFFASELVEGSDLRRLLESGSLPVKKALDLAEQIASGLATAHEKGIVHRDLKPENILITRSGVAKIADFGLAKLVESSVSQGPTFGGHRTSAGMIVGTVGYMSPEQVRGQSVDPRSDIFSFGSLLYEMLTGRKAFERGTAADTMAQILRDEPEPLEQVIPNIPAPVRLIVERCLAKEPAARYDGSHDLARDLASSRAQLVGVGMPAPGGLTKAQSRWLVAVGTIVLVAVLAIPAARLARQRSPGPPPTGSSRAQPAAAESTSIAVLPFVNMGPDASQEYFSDGLSEELLNSLANIPQLRVISRTSSFQFKGKSEDIRTIAKKLNVARVLEGSVRKSGKHVRVTAQLVDADTGSHLWSQTYDRDLDDIFSVQDDIARSVANASRVTLLGLEGTRLASHGRNADAYNLFLQAKQLSLGGTRESLEKAIKYYEQALKLDPGRAAYWVGLASVHTLQVSHTFVPANEGFRQSREEVDKALALDPRMAEAHTILGFIRMAGDWDWEGADASYQQALRFGPGNAKAIGGAAMMAGAMGRFGEAIALYRRATRLDPLNPYYTFNLGVYSSYAGRLEDAEAALRKVLELSPEQSGAYAALGRICLLRARPKAALDEMQKERHPSWRRYGLALTYYALGRKKEADSALAELVEKDGGDAALQIAEAYAYRRETDRAFQWLERAYAQRDPGLAVLKGNPLLRNLERDPRYGAFLRKMRLPE